MTKWEGSWNKNRTATKCFNANTTLGACCPRIARALFGKHSQNLPSVLRSMRIQQAFDLDSYNSELSILIRSEQQESHNYFQKLVKRQF